MAEETAGEKTEEATQRRRQKERERGRAAKSRDLSAASVLLAGMVLLRFGGPTIYSWLHGGTVRLLALDLGGLRVPYGNEIMPHVYLWLEWIAYALGPFMLGLFVVAVVANIAQVGFLFSFEPLTPDLNKLNPVSGLKRIFSLKGFMVLVMNIIKLTIVAVITWLTLRREMPGANTLAFLEPGPIFVHTARAVVNFGLLLALVFFVLGLADMIYQFHQHSVDLRMTKQEVKEELKEVDGDPQIKARRRAIQRQMAMQRMMQEVPEAEVVVRNPTHFAVAIKYRPSMPAPVLVAKGMNLMAKRIIEVAKQHGVPVYERPELARELYRKVEIGDRIPPALFHAVAEVMAYVLEGEKRARYLRALQGAA